MPSKQMKRVKLHGVDADRKLCDTNHTDDVEAFIATNGSEYDVRFAEDLPNGVWLTTKMGSYPLKKHPTLNYYHGTCNGIKVQVSLKKIVGEIRYWA